MEIGIIAKFKNNNLRAKRIALGFDTVAAFCRAYKKYGIYQAQIGKYENFQDYPKKPGLIKKFEVIFKCPIEDLFPSEYKQAVDMKLGRNILETSIETDRLLPGIDNVGLLPSPVELYEKVELAKNIKKALYTLTEREAEILKMQYGLDGENEHDVKEIAEILKISRTRIAQIRAKALRKLKHPRSGLARKTIQDSEGNYIY